jgi:glycosyltransferase involved in cell wall biosynthesis
MRVAFVNQTGKKPGGAEESLALLLTNLPSDIEPSVVMFEDGEYAERLRTWGFTTHIVPIPETLRSVTRERPSASGALAIPAVVAELTRLFRRERFDIVQTNTMKAHFAGSLAARLSAIPVVMHMRDMVEGSGRAALRVVASTCAREHVAISSALSDWYGIAHTTVIPNPVDLSRYGSLIDRPGARRQLGIPTDDVPLIGIVGRINRWKGHDRFLYAAARVNAKRPIRCAIIGEARFRDADFVPELHQLARDLQLADRTTFVPWLDDPRVAYAALDVHCNASVREPFGRSIVEAAAAGVPTVAFDDGGATDIIRHGTDGYLVKAGDSAAFAAAIEALVADRHRRDDAGEAARVGSSRFAAPEHARRVSEIFRRTISRKIKRTDGVAST